MTDPIRAAAERLLQHLDQHRSTNLYVPLFLDQAEVELRAALAAPIPPAGEGVMSSDPIRDLVRELLDYAVMCGGILKSEGLWDEGDDCSDGLLDRARTILAAPTPEPDTDAVLGLAAIIREVGSINHRHGAAALAEAILAHPAAREVFAAPAPPADPDALAARPLLEAVAQMGDCVGRHTVGQIMALSNRAASWLNENPPGQPVAIEPRGCPTPGACSCVQPVAPTPPADGEAKDLAANLESVAIYLLDNCCNDLADYVNSAADYVEHAAALLRQLPPKGLEAIRYCVADDGAVIQRTSKAPESWAVRSCGYCMSHTGEWEIEPQPSDRTHEWLATHRWPTVAAAWAALQQARRERNDD